MLEWWQPMLTDPTRLEDADYRIYAVQTMARALCTLETGKLRSKPGAIRWALEHLNESWHETIHKTQVLNQSPTLEQTKTLIEYAIEFRGST